MTKHSPDPQTTDTNATTNTAPETDVSSEAILRAASHKDKEFQTKFGKNPSQAYVLSKLKESETFKDCATYEDAMKIVKEGKDPANRNFSGKSADLYYWVEKNVLSPEAIEEKSERVDLENIYGKTPVEFTVLKKLKELQPNVYGKCTSYDEAMEIVKDRRPQTYERLQKNVSPRHPLQDADEETIDQDLADRDLSPADIEKAKQQEIEQKKQELLAPNKPTTPSEEKPKKSTGRWTEADEAAWPGSKKIEKKENIAEKEQKEPKQKKKIHFWKGIGKAIARPFKTVGRLGRTAGRTIMIPSYFLADMGEKKKTGGADLAKGYKEIWTGKKKAA